MRTLILLILISVCSISAHAETWTATHYCACEKCCGKYADGVTASGRMAQESMVAINWLPFGTEVVIDGKTYTVEDRGAKSIFGDKNNHLKRVDIYCDTHAKARRLGIKIVDLTITRG